MTKNTSTTEDIPMDQVHFTTTGRKKGQHLSYDDRMVIQLRLKDGWKSNRIAKEIGCAANTVRNEIRRGSVSLYNGLVQRYKAKAGQKAYEANRRNCCRHYDRLSKAAFISYVEKHFQEDGWSLDACVGRALLDGGFSREQIVCTKTLYNYVSLGLLGIKNIDLPEKLKRNTRLRRIRENKRMLGRSIEERPKEIETRKEFGHWECDLVLGSKNGKDQVLLTMSERKSREFWMIPLPNRSKESVMRAMEAIHTDYREHFGEVFKTITTDNGSEFALLSDVEKLADTLVYFTHPYTAWEKGTVERHNGLIRRFLRKGKRIDSYSAEQIAQIEMWSNSLPRKVLGYRTPDEVFEEELDKIYGMAM